MSIFVTESISGEIISGSFDDTFQYLECTTIKDTMEGKRQWVRVLYDPELDNLSLDELISKIPERTDLP